MRKHLIFGMLALVLALGLVFVACSSDSDGDSSSGRYANILVKGKDADKKPVEIEFSTNRLPVSDEDMTIETGDSYVIRLDGSPVSSGTVEKDRTYIKYVPSDGSPSFIGNYASKNNFTLPTITRSDGTAILKGFALDGIGTSPSGGSGTSGGTGQSGGPSPLPSTPGNPINTDFDITNAAHLASVGATAVQIKPKAGKSTGAITVYYEDAGGTRSTAVPTLAGTYDVYFDVAAVSGFRAAINLYGGNFYIYNTPQTPVGGDFIVKANPTYSGSPVSIEIIPLNGTKSTGKITIVDYSGTANDGSTILTNSTTAPTEAGDAYTVTFNIAASSPPVFSAVTGLSINFDVERKALTNADFEISLADTDSTVGVIPAFNFGGANLTAFATTDIVPKAGLTGANGTVASLTWAGTKADGTTAHSPASTKPGDAGTYTVTFNVGVGNNYLAATGFSLRFDVLKIAMTEGGAVAVAALNATTGALSITASIANLTAPATTFDDLEYDVTALNLSPTVITTTTGGVGVLQLATTHAAYLGKVITFIPKHKNYFVPAGNVNFVIEQPEVYRVNVTTNPTALPSGVTLTQDKSYEEDGNRVTWTLGGGSVGTLEILSIKLSNNSVPSGFGSTSGVVKYVDLDGEEATNGVITLVVEFGEP